MIPRASRNNRTNRMSRRQAILGMGAAILGSPALAPPALAELLGPVPPRIPEPAGQQENAADAALDDRLRKQLADMASRADSEAGVPVMLACIDLVAARNPKKHSPELTGLNKAFAAEFERNAAAWERLKPSATEADFGSLIQVLAARDFAEGGTGGQR